MAVYQLAPSPSIAIPEQSVATWENGFTDEEIEQIISIGDALTLHDAVLAGNSDSDISKIRASKTGWMGLTPETHFIYDNLAYIARQLNGQFFDLDVWGFVEDLQFTVYDGKEDHYTWHVDRGGNTQSPRKLSLVLQLSDPSEYEGGELEIFDSPEPRKMEKKKGLVVAFPSFVLHRVTPVTSGIRKTLVVWLSGPRFK